jgi:predicted Zn-dependent protease with MMP-like domain
VSAGEAGFEELVQRALDSLPPEFSRKLENVAVVVEDEHPEDPDLLGFYDGVPLPERSGPPPSLPDKITIYRRPLEESFTDPFELEQQIRITVLHELAHYFGIDEERLDELGYR